MKRKFLILLLLVTSLYPLAVGAQDLCYQMASYQTGGRSVASTPLFDVGIFNSNQGCFPLATREQVGSTNYVRSIQFLFDLAMGVSIALAVILFTFGAAQGILEDVFSYNLELKDKIKANERMKNSLVGLLIILSMWLVVNTINPDLLRLPLLQSVFDLQSTSGGKTIPTTNVRIN